MNRRALLIINTNARRGNAARGEAHAALADLSFDVIDVEPRDSAHIEREMMMHRDDVDVAIIGGGDGTIVSSIDGFRKSGLPMGLLPIGTINDLGRTLNIPLDIRAACGVIAQGHLQTIDVGSVNGKYFVNEASVGISTRIARAQTTEVKRKFGMFAIAATALQAIRHSRPFAVDIAQGDRRTKLQTIQLTVANSHHFGAWITNRDARIGDGNLDLYALQVDRWWHMVRLFGSVLRQRFDDEPSIKTFRDTEFLVTTRRPRSVFTDGEPATKTPARFTVVPDALRLFVPRKAS